MSVPPGSPGGLGFIDLNQRIQELGLSYEPPEQIRARMERELLELKHRLEEEKRQTEHERNAQQSEAAHKRETDITDAKHRRRIFWCVFSVVIAAAVVALWVGLFDRTAAAETQAWARTIGSAIIAGVVGYFGGTAGKAPG